MSVEHGLHRCHAARTERVERISELLDLSGLFSVLLLHPCRDRKCLSYTGGIRVSGLIPLPLWRFGVLPHEGRLPRDDQRFWRRSLGADVRLAGSRALAWAPQRRHQGRFPGADPGRGCAGAGLRREALQRAADALHAARLLIEDAARTLEELQSDALVLRALETATGLLKTRPFMERLPWVDVTYCKYGTPYRKQTRLWTNMRWRPSRGLCRRGSRCDEKEPHSHGGSA